MIEGFEFGQTQKVAKRAGLDQFLDAVGGLAARFGNVEDVSLQQGLALLVGYWLVTPAFRLVVVFDALFAPDLIPGLPQDLRLRRRRFGLHRVEQVALARFEQIDEVAIQDTFRRVNADAVTVRREFYAEASNAEKNRCGWKSKQFVAVGVCPNVHNTTLSRPSFSSKFSAIASFQRKLLDL